METGIYRHSNGNLFFVEGTGSFFDPREADKPAVFLCCLTDGRKCCILRKNFNNEREKFELVQALSVEKMPLLLSLVPGALVQQEWMGRAAYRVKRIFEKAGEVFVQLEIIGESAVPVPTLLSAFLDGTLVVCKSAE